MSIAPPLSRRQRWNIAGLFACLILFYVWTSSTCEWAALPRQNLQFYYNHLQRAFMNGQLHLLIQPRPELLALPDPYDPIANERFRLHDAVYFKGKYYLYYGAAPVVLLFIPFHILTGLDLSEPLAVVIFCTLGLVYSFRLLELLRRHYVPETPFGVVLAAVPALGFGNIAPFVLRRPLHYEVAISAGYAFSFAAIYYFVAGLIGERVNRRALLIGSLLLGCAGGSRFPTFVAGFVAVVLFAYRVVSQRDRPLREHVLTAAACGVPAGLCLLLLLVYNHVRFDSWTEFGMHYTLQGYQSARTYIFYSVDRVPIGFFYYVLVPPRIRAVFPFFRAEPEFYAMPPHDYYVERIVGILPTVPLLGILFLAPAYWPALRQRGPAALVGASLVAIGSLLLFLFCLAAGTMRYELDFGTYFLVPAMLLWYGAFAACAHSVWKRRLVGTAFAIALAGTMAVSGALSLTGYYDSLEHSNPEIYQTLHDLFRPLEHWLGAK